MRATHIPPLKTGLIVSAGIALLGGCRVLGGPCHHTFHDPVLVVTGVRDPNGNPVSRITISDLAFLGRPVTDFRVLLLLPSFNVRQVGNDIECSVECGFGVEEGEYRFTATAATGATTVRVQARYRDFDGGCPSSNSGSTRITVQLSPN